MSATGVTQAHPVSATAPRAPYRLRWLGVVGALLPAVLCFALAGYTLNASRLQYEQRAEVLTQNLADALEQGVTAHIEKIDMALGTITELVESRLRQGSLNLSEVDGQMLAMTSRRSEVEALRIIDAQGLGIFGPGLAPDSPPVSYGDRDWFIAQRDKPDQGLYMSRPLVGRVNGVWMVAFSRRYNTPDGRFGGCVSAAVPLSYFQKRLEAMNVGNDGFVTLRNTTLELVARHSPKGTLTEPPGGTRASQALRTRIESGQMRATYRFASPVDTFERTTSMRRLTLVPLVVVVGLNSEDYLADWHKEARAAAGLSLAIVLLYGVGAVLMWRARRHNRQVRQRVELLAKVFEHSAEAIMVTDHHHRIIEINPAFTRQSGWQPAEIIGQDPSVLYASQTTAEQQALLREAMAQQGSWRGEMWTRAKNGHEYPIWLSLSVLKDSHGRITHHISSATDITEQKLVEDRIRHLAHHDALTQLPNRVLLHARLEQAMALARREGSGLAMLFIDMDRFKNINDTLGHPVGDGLLVEVGQRLVALVRESDIVARLGGDEFVLVLTAVGGDAATVGAAVARKLLTELGRPYLVRGHALHSTPSIGIGLFPADGADADALMKNADAAMYQAKSAGRNNFQFYTEAMNQATSERLAIEAGLRGALERGEMFLNYQPQLDVPTGRLVGVEALLRWCHPELGEVPPATFIPVAEDIGQIEAIGAWVLDEALRQLAAWRQAGLALGKVQGPGSAPGSAARNFRMAVNLSAQQLRSDAFAAQVSEVLLRHRLPGDALELEITESVAMRDPVRTAELLRELRRQGVALAIDDFGTGYSSLSYLKQLPLSCLKLDRSFVMDIERDPNDAAICTATIQLAHSLGLAVVAEGVETEAQLEFLRRLGCDTVQGYFISRPMLADDCAAFMAAAGQAETALLAV